MNSAFWYRRFAFSLRIYSELCVLGTPNSRFHCGSDVPGTWRAHQIRSFIVFPKRFLHTWRFAGRANSRFRRNHTVFQKKHKEGSAGIPRGALSQFERQTCFHQFNSAAEPNGARFRFTIQPIPYTSNFVHAQTPDRPLHGAATRILLRATQLN